MNTPVIETKDLHKKYKNVIAVKDLNLKVERGEIFGLVGADGAGKTTTIQMLCTLSLPSSGEARILGMDSVKQAGEIKQKIGYMSERFNLYSTLTIEENIDFFARLHNLSPDISEPRKKELLSFCRLEPFRKRQAEYLSGGMQKKLALACSLIHEPEVIFLDEPTTGVDPVSRRDFWKIIAEFISKGVTVLVSTPYLDEAERFNKVAFMYQGKIITCDTPHNLKAEMRGEILEIRASPTRQTVDSLKTLSFAGFPQLFGETIHILVDNAKQRRPEVISALQQKNIKIYDIRSVLPSLEDTFVSHIIEMENTQSSKRDNSPFTISLVKENESSETTIKVSELTRKFGDFTAVDQVTFEVRRGEIFGLLGPNGSGKTTIIRMITGLLVPTLGSVRVLGYDMAKDASTSHSKMGYMSQKFSLYNDLTVDENINFYGGLYGLSRSQLTEGKKWVLDMAELSGKEKSMPRELSGGWKQRLSLGCTIIHNPEVIFLDEPTAGIDPFSRRSFWQLIEELAAGGTTIFITTHYMDEAEHCHRVGIMYQGKLIAIGSPLQLKTSSVKGEMVEVVCSDFTRALALLSEKANYQQISLFGNTIHVKVENAKTASLTIGPLLERNKIIVHSISPIPFTMEDIFISLVEEYEE